MGFVQDVLNKVRISRNLPQRKLDTNEGDSRGGSYGEQMVQVITPSKHVLADEGSYFTACNPTPGTGIQLAANVTAFSDTNGLFVFRNKDGTGPAAKRIYLDYIRLLLTGTAPTATVSMEFAIKRSRIDREPAAANARTPLSPVNMASNSQRDSICIPMSYANAAAMLLVASQQSDPVLARFRIATGLGVSGDQYLIKFGGDDLGASRGGAAVRATDPGQIVVPVPPIIIEPGESAAVHMWWLTAATTAATFEFEVGWWER